MRSIEIIINKFSLRLIIMNKYGKTTFAKILIDIIGFILIIGGSLLVRFNPDERVSIIGGILVAIGVGLLSLSRTI